MFVLRDSRFGLPREGAAPSVAESDAAAANAARSLADEYIPYLPLHGLAV
jgi:hypothetical protein